ncbi:tetratricopeptide repeat-containing glycosyltransferase [Limobrevibacterium gyesilva]|uniref:Tetratricopeptide repeat protein n=1 Tax=Limobrevibacterium gyesilva TaxID=2991712 RepID=A0AA41YU72_9PROT|nr:hypothetical protein [Limobrevibacterium gyesilva]MCW3476560.1 hypothetical protein [Limobrevibacterium gyesilva]
MPLAARCPIVIISFNRPDYLRKTLESLVGQAGIDLQRRSIFLFQDGAVNEFSGRTHCDPALAAANIELFRTLVPQGVTRPAPRNLGVALNFDRAERFVFEELNADAAIFLEDDLVLGPYYLKTLERLLDLAVQDERIGYVAAYGNHRASHDEQMRHRSTLIPMGHNWGFGLTRRQWLRQRPYVDQYLDIVRSADYRGRDHDKIIDLFHSWGLGVPGTSQDIAKTHATILTNAAKIVTYPCFGHYIGESGLHFDSDTFRKMGFGNTHVMTEDVFQLVRPTDAQLNEIISVIHRSAMIEAVQRRNPASPPVRPSATPSAPVPGDASPQELQRQVRALLGAGRTGDAEQLCSKALAAYPEYRDEYGHPCFLKEAVRLALARRDVEAARKLAMNLLAQIRKGDPCVHILFGRHYARTGDTEAARREAEAVLAVDPTNSEAATWATMASG